MSDEMLFYVDYNEYLTEREDGYVTISANPCNLLGLIVENVSASTVYCMVMDIATDPVNGGLGSLSLKLAPGAQESLTLPGPRGFRLTNGLTIGSSSTSPTFTSTGSDDLVMQLFWI